MSELELAAGPKRIEARLVRQRDVRKTGRLKGIIIFKAPAQPIIKKVLFLLKICANCFILRLFLVT